MVSLILGVGIFILLHVKPLNKVYIQYKIYLICIFLNKLIERYRDYGHIYVRNISIS